MPTRSGGGALIRLPPSRALAPASSRHTRRAFTPAASARPGHADGCACLLGCLQGGYGVGAGGALARAAAGERGEALGLPPHRLQLGPLPLRRVEEVAAHGAAGAERLRARHVARGVIPAQRDEAGAAAGQLRDHLRAVHVRGLVRGLAEPAGDQAGRHRRQAGDVLAGQPAELIELVHAHVDEDAAAVGAERRRRRLQVPLVAGHQVDGAQLTGGHPLAQLRPARARTAASTRPGTAPRPPPRPPPPPGSARRSPRTASRTGSAGRARRPRR